MTYEHQAIAIDRKHSRDRHKSLPLWARIILDRLENVKYGALSISFPGTQLFRIDGPESGPDAYIHIKSPGILWSLFSGGALGVARAYLDDQFDTPDLATLLSFGISNEDELKGLLSVPLASKFLANIRHVANANTKKGSRRNIAFHYDLGNEFYGLWLDETMTYSSAIFTNDNQSLKDAQNAKYERIGKELALKPSDHVLEIGCGWGGFAEYAAKTIGCKITCLTLSVEQANYARKRIHNAGLGHLVEIRIEDYRDCTGQFDKIVSIEMFEAVGEKNWPIYFAQIEKLLTFGGEVLIQVITIAEDRFEYYRKNADFIQSYIFPGGMLPTSQRITEEAKDKGLELRDQYMFGKDYETTLLRWDQAFSDRWSEIATLGFDDRFKRMWRYYLHYCAAGFRTQRIDVGQFRYRKP